MINWSSEVRSLISLADDVTDDRIHAVVPISIVDLSALTGVEETSTLLEQEDSRAILAVAQFAVSRLILSLRELSAVQAISDSEGLGVGWGEGTLRAARGDSLLTISQHWRGLAVETARQIQRAQEASSDEPRGWYDI